VFVDDFLDYGKTLSRVAIELSKKNINIIGVYLYNQLGNPEYLLDTIKHSGHDIKFAFSEHRIFFDKIRNKNVLVGRH
jgi:hypoxanthine phosphoribosyltransferase